MLAFRDWLNPRQFLEGLLRLWYPPACEMCGNACESELLCACCITRLTATAALPVCDRCAATRGPHAVSETGCDLCRRDRFAFERVLRLGSYQNELAEACRRIKEWNGARLATALADLFIQRQIVQLQQWAIDVVVPIPLHWRRECLRGYNQSAVIAEQFGRSLARPVGPKVLVRRRSTRLQTRLSPTARRENVRNAFCCRRIANVKGKVVLLADDILTTGATCHEAARALKSAGARAVYVAVLARGENLRR